MVSPAIVAIAIMFLVPVAAISIGVLHTLKEQKAKKPRVQRQP
jgi:hypothetical protein